MPMFEGFDERRVTVGDASIYLRTGGVGPPLLLLHGYPQTHFSWHAVAPRLRDDFTLVIPDLPGYGRSDAPAADPGHLRYAKRRLARDMLHLMRTLGYGRFRVAGIDRGGRVAYRLTLDHPEAVERLAVLDIVPTYEMWRRMGHAGALRSYHWSFLAQPAPLPEHLIGGDPDFYLTHLLRRWSGDFDALAPAAIEDYRTAFRRPEVIAATCADYRSGATVDVDDDRDDAQAGRRITCPTRVIWATRYLSSQSPLPTWREWCEQVDEVEIDCGHFIAEEQPEACARAMREFLAR